MPTSSNEISGMITVTAEAFEMRNLIAEMVQSRRSPQKSAAHDVARQLGIKPRRVVALLRGEITRVWADELAIVRRRYAAFLDAEAARAEAHAALLRVRREEIARENA